MFHQPFQALRMKKTQMHIFFRSFEWTKAKAKAETVILSVFLLLLKLLHK
jgi:hypothetical protein